ncbi:unnamed protein product [Somion occarium]|uniref:Uncharacterized protein n=1 Tax=Somion occarium TaxID=3059160 RepID=A0ABP1CYY6_9APHY
MPPTGQRRNTVYDLAALRIHHDDFRIPSSDSNYAYRRDKKITRDVRGNWIAKDAGGTGRVPLYKKISDDEEGGSEEKRDDEGETTQFEDEVEEEEEGEGEEEEEEGEEYRRRQRRRFYEDMSYLEHKANDLPHPPGTMPVPESDLLKTIHYFASVYYNDMGQLHDAKRFVRRLYKKRREEKRKSAAASSDEDEDEFAEQKATHGPDEDEAIEDDGEQSDTLWTDEDEPIPDADEDLRPRKRQNKGKGKETDKKGAAGKRKRKKRQEKDWTEAYRNQDMYRRFDGSALIALGMLLQEYVREKVGRFEPDEPLATEVESGVEVEAEDRHMEEDNAEEESRLENEPQNHRTFLSLAQSNSESDEQE